MRVRFAPSPTGFLHVGGARTALYNYLLARQSGGTFVLRIEDTDRERSTDANVAQILDALKWLELDWDEGPISQAERGDRHRQELERLVESGQAYRSAAAAEDVKAERERSGTGYRGEDEAGAKDAAIRLRVPDQGETVVEDLIRGPTSFDNRLLDDFVIARSDGTPLYNFAVAVDDRDMEISHVIRGEDHLSNTPRQLLVFSALEAQAPKYAHLPLLHGTDGKKLSKRHGSASVQELQQQGFVPEAVCNYLALLGWGYDDKTTFFSREELTSKFSIERVSSSPAVFDIEKLRWMNGNYLRKMDDEGLALRLYDYLDGTVNTTPSTAALESSAPFVREKIATLADFWPLAHSLFERPEYDQRSWQKVFAQAESRDRLQAARETLVSIEPFNEQSVEDALRGLCEQLGEKPKLVFQPIRVAVTGSTVSPGLFETLAFVGREEVLVRIDVALAKLDS